MILMICVDDKNGMLFHNRRQSRDRALTGHILHLTGAGTLWVSPFSQSLFPETGDTRLLVDEDYLLKARPGDYCFVEDRDVSGFTDRIEKIILFKWNKVYPADTFLTLDLSLWKLTKSEDFPGYSHEKITKEIYVK